jgi:hypothetical protein
VSDREIRCLCREREVRERARKEGKLISEAMFWRVLFGIIWTPESEEIGLAGTTLRRV